MAEDNVVPINEDIEVEEPIEEPITVLEATARLAGDLATIAKRTKTTPEFCMNIYAFFLQQEQAAAAKRQQEEMMSRQAQDSIDAIGREAHEVIDADE